MDRRSFFKRAGGVVGAALFIPADRLVFGVPTQALAAPAPAVIVPDVFQCQTPAGMADLYAEMFRQGYATRDEVLKATGVYDADALLIEPPTLMRMADPRWMTEPWYIGAIERQGYDFETLKRQYWQSRGIG